MKTIYLKVEVPEDYIITGINAFEESESINYETGIECAWLEIHLPTEDEIETAALNYRDKSDDENTDEDTMQIKVHWYDKQKAFISGVKWLLK
jgi:hypothetical protein